MLYVEQYKIRKQLSSSNGIKVFEVVDIDRNLPHHMRLIDCSSSHHNEDQWFELYENYQLTITNYKNLPRVSTITYSGSDQVYTLLDFQDGERLIDKKILTRENLEQLMDAIQHLHRKKIIHGSISAENIWITHEGRILLYGTGEWRVLSPEKKYNFADDVKQFLTIIQQYAKIEKDVIQKIILSKPKKIEEIANVIFQSGMVEKDPPPIPKKRVGLVEKQRGGLAEKEIDPKKDVHNQDQTTLFKDRISVGQLQFFETKGDGDFLSEKERVYKNEFSQIAHINWALTIKYPPTESRQVLYFECIYYDPVGTVKSRRSLKKYAAEGTTSFSISESFRFSEQRNWKPGKYRAVILFVGKLIAKGEFTISKPQPTFAVEQVKKKALCFFETSDKNVFVSKEERVYQYDFQQLDHTVNWELMMSYPLTHERYKLHLECKYSDARGNEIGKRLFNLLIKEGTATLTFSEGIPIRDTIKWKLGTYRVLIFVNGMKLIENSFQIIKPKESILDLLKVEYLSFFESRDEMPKKENRLYKTSFSKASTRYVNWEINLSHPVAEKYEPFTLEFVYYNPNGSVFCRDKVETYIEKGWDHSWHSMGHGYSKAGNWLPGKYKVEILLKGNRIAESYFAILNDKFFELIKVDSVRLFESGFETPNQEERLYQTYFSQENTRYVNWEINLIYPQAQNRKLVKFDYVYYKEDGTIFGKHSQDSYIEQGWTSSIHSMGYGYQDPGNWTAGRYIVEIKIAEKVMAQEYFEIGTESVSAEEKKWFHFWK